MASFAELFNWRTAKEPEPKNTKDALVNHSVTNTAVETYSLSGESNLTERDIVGIPAVSAALDTITGAIAQLPIELYKPSDDGEGKQKISDDYRLNLLNNVPNSNLTGYAFKRKVAKDVILYGASKSYIEYESPTSNTVAGIYPLDMSKVNIQVKTANGYSYYGLVILNSNAGQQVFYDDLLLSVIKDTDDGITGKGLISEHFDILQLAKNQSDYENHLLENGATPTSVLETDSKMTDDIVHRVMSTWKSLYSGVKNAGKTAILENGLHYKPISYGPDDLQLTEGKKSVISDIARILNIPESMINSTANKYDSAEQNNLWFLQTTLSPFLVAFENSLNNSLLTEDEKAQGYQFLFDSTGMNKLTTEEQTDVIIKKLNAGIISVPKAAKQLGETVDPNEQEYFRLTTGVAMYDPSTGNIANPNTGVVMNINTGKVVKDGIEQDPEELQKTQNDKANNDDKEKTNEEDDK